MNTTSIDKTNTDTNTLTYKYLPYDAQLPVNEIEGCRVVKVLYKENPKTGTKAGENSYINIPCNHLTEEVLKENFDRLSEFFLSYMQEQENQIIKAHHKAGGLGFTASFLSLDKIVDYLQETGQSARLNKEKIANWFTSEMEDKLIDAFAGKLGIDIASPTDSELEKLAAITATYRAKYESLASPKVVYKKEECELLQKALNVTGADKSVIGSKFVSRLESMKNVSANDLLLGL